MIVYEASETTSSVPTFASWGCWKEKKDSKECEKMTENFPNPVKETDTQIQEAQSPKQDVPKEAHTKAHHN